MVPCGWHSHVESAKIDGGAAAAPLVTGLSIESQQRNGGNE